LSKLKKLELSSNYIESLGQELTQLSSLEYLGLEMNKIKDKKELLKLSKMLKLSVIKLNGNPVSTPELHNSRNFKTLITETKEESISKENTVSARNGGAEDGDVKWEKCEIEKLKESLKCKEEHLLMLKRQLTERSIESCFSDADDFLVKEEKASASEIAELKCLIKSKEQSLKHIVTNNITKEHNETESKLVNVLECKENELKEQCLKSVNLKEMEKDLLEVVNLFNGIKPSTDTNIVRRIQDTILLTKKLAADSKSQISRLQQELNDQMKVNGELNEKLDAHYIYTSFNSEPIKSKKLSIQEVKNATKDIISNLDTKATNSRQVDYFATNKSYYSNMATGTSDKYRTLREQNQYNELLEKYLELKKDKLKPETIKELFCTNSCLETIINKYSNRRGKKSKGEVVDENSLEVLISTFVANVKKYIEIKKFSNSEVRIPHRSKSVSKEPHDVKIGAKARKLKADIETMKQEILAVRLKSDTTLESYRKAFNSKLIEVEEMEMRKAEFSKKCKEIAEILKIEEEKVKKTKEELNSLLKQKEVAKKSLADLEVLEYNLRRRLECIEILIAHTEKTIEKQKE